MEIAVHTANETSIRCSFGGDMTKIIRFPFPNTTFMTFQERACIL